MQTSKIVVGDIYAVRVSGAYARFKVTRIMTEKNTHGTSSHVYGEMLDATDGKPAGYKTDFPPGDIEGPYEQFQELAEKKRKENEARDLRAKREADRAEAIFTAFCKLLGHPKPKKVKQRWDNEPKYDNDEPFRLDYSNNIDINKAGMDILAAFFKVDVEKQEVSDNVVNLNTTA